MQKEGLAMSKEVPSHSVYSVRLSYRNMSTDMVFDDIRVADPLEALNIAVRKSDIPIYRNCTFEVFCLDTCSTDLSGELSCKFNFLQKEKNND